MMNTLWIIVGMLTVLVYVYFTVRLKISLTVQESGKKVNVLGKRIHYIVAPGVSVFIGWISLYMLIFHNLDLPIRYSRLLLPAIIGGGLAAAVSYMRVRLLKNFTHDTNQADEQNATKRNAHSETKYPFSSTVRNKTTVVAAVAITVMVSYMMGILWLCILVAVILVYNYFEIQLSVALIRNRANMKVNLPRRRILYILIPGISFAIGWLSFYMFFFVGPDSPIQYNSLLIPMIVGSPLITAVTYPRVQPLDNFSHDAEPKRENETLS